MSTDRRFVCAVDIAIVVWWLALASLAQQPEQLSTKLDDSPGTTPRVVTIPDGTPVELRFAQSLRGFVPKAWGRFEIDAKVGDHVRLVCAEDAKVAGMVLIPKGAIAQATVTDVSVPDRKAPLPETGLEIGLDWVRDVTGKIVSLRASEKGKAGSFMLEVVSMKGGMVARPASLKRNMIDTLSYKWMFTAWHLQTFAPAGTRITAYVHGNIERDPDDVKQAQSLLPVPNANSVLTIYRTKSSIADLLRVYCDDKEAGTLAPKEQVTLGLAPGDHACRLEKEKPVTITAQAGEEYYIHLRHRAMSDSWELQQVSKQEGEDSTAKLEATNKSKSAAR